MDITKTGFAKVLLINGSPRKKGNTLIALEEIAGILAECGIETPIVQLGNKAVQGCIACNICVKRGRCVFEDEVYDTIIEQMQESDGIIIGSPVYFAGPNGSLCAVLDRVFYSCNYLMHNKPGAAIAVCRRGGASAALDRLNKYIIYSRMQLIGSQCWNLAHGLEPGEILEDEEGLQTMRTLARNFAWAVNNIRNGDAPPEREKPRMMTDFVNKRR